MRKKRKRFFILIFIVLIVGIFVVSSAQESKGKISEEVYGKLEESDEVRVIIKLKIPEEKGFLIKTKKTAFEIELEKQEIKEQVINDVRENNVKHVFDDYIAASISEKELNKLNKNPDVESVIIDKPIKAFLQDSIPLINASIVWPIKLSGINITGIDETVCILDTGINFSHSDLAGKNKTCTIDCVNKTCVENCSISDDNGHGTHVAGIVGASRGILGVAINISLIGVKVLNSAGEGSSSDLDAGIDWCIANADAYNISVISMSLGTEAPDLYDNYCDGSVTTTALRINNATSQNISVIAATGNDGNTTHIASPACIENTTAVGATDKSDSITSYSNRNNITDLVAPGGTSGAKINSTSIDGGYANMYGTSMSAPHVAGAFALIRQFYRLQSNRILKPSEIEDALNDTGKQVEDSTAGLNFSRIDVYSAILSLDTVAPNVSLISPTNATISSNVNQTFSCNATDLQLSNITFYLWNSTSLFNQTTVNISGTFNETSFSLTNLSYDNYEWNCFASDANGNSAFATNFSLTIRQFSVILNSPSDNTFTNQNQTYNCSAETRTAKPLTNITFYLWNSTNNLINNSNLSISGTSNSTTFQYNFSKEDSYLWNCLAYNNESESSWADSNYTITFDVTKPNITLISPSDGTSSTTTSYNFTFNVNDTNNISNCTLILDNTIINNLDSVSKTSANGMYNSSLAVGSHSWSVNCTDVAGNTGNSSLWSLTITSPQQITISSGGGRILSYKTYIITAQQASSGYTKELKKDDKIEFTFFDERAKKHTLTVKEISKDYVNLTIHSPINLILGIGQSAKLNLTTANYYDLYIKLEDIINNRAKLTIRTIHEEIPKPKITREIAKEKEKQLEEKPTKPEEKRKIINKIKNISIIILILIIFILIVIIFSTKKIIIRIRQRRKKREKREQKKRKKKGKKGRDK